MRMLLRRRPFLLALGVLAPWQGARAATLKVFGPDRYPPMIYLRHGRPVGLLPDLLRRVEARSADLYALDLVPWARALELARRGAGGLIGVTRTQERLQWLDFSEPVMDDSVHLVMLKERAFAYRGLEDLKGKHVGGTLGTSYGDEMDRAIASGLFTVDRDLGMHNRLHKLLRGRLDAALIGIGRAGFDYLLSSDAELLAARDRFEFVPTPVVSNWLHLAFAKSLEQTLALQRFNQALAPLRNRRE